MKENTKKNVTEIVFILDRSGSMSGLEKDTIGGFNSMLKKQKKEEGEAVVSTILFDDRTEVLHNRIPLNEVEPLTEEQYYVRGCTALLDAVGGAIDYIKKARKEMPKEERPDKTIFIITTDGMENSSKKYSYAKVKKMIEKRKAKNWEFLFLGANIDAVSEAAKFGISRERAVKYECDAVGTRTNFRVLAETVARACAAPCAAKMSAAIGDDWAAEIEEDYESRHR